MSHATRGQTPDSAFPDGVLVVDKPIGPTSHDVVAVARRALGVSRIGHTGTLDPMASGVLPLVVGRATRLAQYLTTDRKDYEATVTFGHTTDSYDAMGQVLTTAAQRPTRAELDAAIEQFRGAFQQTPPAFSAKSIDGERSYNLARRPGQDVVRPKAVAVTTERLEILAFDGDTVQLAMRVTAGFYVRSLAHDLGAALGMGAVLSALRRTRSGDFDLAAAVPLADVVQGPREALAGRVLPFDSLLGHLPAVMLKAGVPERVKNGLEVGPNDAIGDFGEPSGLVRFVGPDGRLVGLAKAGKTPGFLHAAVVFG